MDPIGPIMGPTWKPYETYRFHKGSAMKTMRFRESPGYLRQHRHR